MSIVVGIIITALITWLITVFGMALFQTYMRYDSHSSNKPVVNLFNPDGEQMGLDPAIDCPVGIGRYRG